jgi:hypothetical protein
MSKYVYLCWTYKVCIEVCYSYLQNLHVEVNVIKLGFVLE